MSSGLDWLFSLADLERGVGWNPRASPDVQWKLGRTRALLDLAGAPDRGLRVALVAGTKGKGSTCAMLASILNAAGWRTGLYTQPHLQSYRERIRVDGQAISSEALDLALERWRERVAELGRVHPSAGEPTTFEVTTALAVDYFAQQGCRIAVIEVGLGGRLDATNALEPELGIITSISYDHTAILGRTLGAIASEKAGILRAGRPGLLAPQRPAARSALVRACRSVGADCREIAATPGLAPSLRGEHQRQNAALAAAAARLLVQPTPSAIQHGLARVCWPGRFELLPGRPDVILDGAHNGASAEALAATLRAEVPGRRLQLVVGMNRDKDARAVLRPLIALAESVWATQASGNVRALEAWRVARVCRRLTNVPVHVQPAIGTALTAACGVAGPSGLVCVTGSLALVGQARTALGLAIAERLWPV